MARKRIGEILLERAIITPAQLEEGLAHQRQTRQRLGVALLQKGFLKEEQLVRALSEATGIPEVDLAAVQPEWSAIHTLRTAFCEANDLFPYAIEPGKGKRQLLVAMSDPLNVPAIEEIEFMTGLKVQPRIAPLSAVRAAILRWYHRRNPADAPEEGVMTVIHKGQAMRVPDAPEEEVIEGEVLDEEAAARDQLAREMRDREQQERTRRAGRKAQSPSDALSEDLDYLFGVRDEEEPVEKLERKFWALMRLMAKKGLITNEEFTRELGEDEGD